MSLTEIIVALLGMGGSAIIAYLAYLRGSRADDDAKENAAIAQVYAGYSGLIERLQVDNTALRAEVAGLRERLSEMGDIQGRLAEAEQRIALLLARKNGS